MPLTKSLHTVTATVNVAKHLIVSDLADDCMFSRVGARELSSRALLILGYRMSDFGLDDPTVAAIVKQVTKLVAADRI